MAFSGNVCHKHTVYLRGFSRVFYSINFQHLFFILEVYILRYLDIDVLYIKAQGVSHLFPVFIDLKVIAIRQCIAFFIIIQLGQLLQREQQVAFHKVPKPAGFFV